MDKIIVTGARENNLKNVSIEIPKNKLTVFTGVSGSGKSSLAFDTIFAEGQRRYVESLSAYARQFIGGVEKPDVDSIEGLSPSISIDQKTTNNNPRSTVGTVTEIYDFLRLLFSRIGVPYCINHHIPITSQSIEEMTNKIMELEGAKVEIMAPIVHGEKGTHKDLFDDLRKEGYSRVRVNGEQKLLEEEITLEKNKKDNIEVIVDRVVIKESERSRIFESIETSCKLANGKVLFHVIGDKEILMSEHYACPECDFSIPELEPRLFSFNSPYGACPECKGLGTKLKISEDLIMPDKDLRICDDAFKGFNLDNNSNYQLMEALCKKYKIPTDVPLKDLKKEQLNILLYGTKGENLKFTYHARTGNSWISNEPFIGIVPTLERRQKETSSDWIRDWLETFMIELPCEVCHGTRLQDSVLSIYIGKKNIYDMTRMSIKELRDFLRNLKLNKEQEKIARLLLKEIDNRLTFLVDVGLDYLTLDRRAGTLSGGEAQRIRLATQIGSKLSGVLYVLDEPSIGLHQKDNEKLIKSLQEMRDLGNTLIVVEHDEDTMRAADYLVEVGPGAGVEGGRIVASGTPEEVMKNETSLTGRYLSGKESIPVPKKRRKGNGLFLEVKGAKENNLKNINVKFPLGKFIAVTGVSGSGKSSLVNEILAKTLQRDVNRAKLITGNCKEIKGIENVDKVVVIDQDPIGRTPRSNPATYVGVFDDIRDVFASTKEAKMHGYDKGRFSFNVKGGRCEACWGDGLKKIEMHFLPDVYVPCDVCHGKRYNKETLAITFKGKNISEVLNMRVSEAVEFFASVPKIKRKLDMLMDVGLSYITLGQSATTLSGGEAGRVKLSKELQKRPTGKSVFILDEPTTGLHSEDIKKLLQILNRIVDNGDTVIVIEHNMDVIKVADYIIDLGPDGGVAGGEIVATGTPEQIAKCEKSYTGEWLKKYLKK
ncbi:MAG: excinuclease ABC subunit UvrA [Bacilli bacterium]|nr:excinuclease ABC subunit UvrA [Bacilli bacterium]